MKQEIPLVSVVIPSYNHEKYITKAIESVIKQTYKNIELFVIDDGSKDNSPKIIKDLSIKYNFYFKTQQNKGHVKTANELYAMCKGKYISCIGSDDIWTLDKIEKQVLFMENNPQIAACYGNIIAINEYDEILPSYKQHFTTYSTYSFNDIITGKQTLFATTEMIRRSIFDLVGPFEENILCEDLNMWLKLTHSGNKLVCLNDLLWFYRRHSDNLSKKIKMMHRDKLIILKKYKGEKGYFKGLINAYRHYYLHLVFDSVRNISLFK